MKIVFHKARISYMKFVKLTLSLADIMWIIDFPTLVLIIGAGLHLGLLGFFGWDAVAAIFGAYTKIAYMAVGASAIWQLSRQRFL